MGKEARRRQVRRQDAGLVMLGNAEKVLKRDGFISPVLMVMGHKLRVLVQYRMPEGHTEKRELLMKLGGSVGFWVDAYGVLAVADVWHRDLQRTALPYLVPAGGLKDDPKVHSAIAVFEVDATGVRRQISRLYDPKPGGGFRFGPVSDTRRRRGVSWEGALFEAFFAGKIKTEAAVETVTPEVESMRVFARAEALEIPGVVIVDERGQRYATN